MKPKRLPRWMKQKKIKKKDLELYHTEVGNQCMRIV